MLSWDGHTEFLLLGLEVGPWVPRAWAEKSKGAGIWIQVVSSPYGMTSHQRDPVGIGGPGMVIALNLPFLHCFFLA